MYTSVSDHRVRCFATDVFPSFLNIWFQNYLFLFKNPRFKAWPNSGEARDRVGGGGSGVGLQSPACTAAPAAASRLWFPSSLFPPPPSFHIRDGLPRPSQVPLPQMHASRRQIWLRPRLPGPATLRRSPRYPPHRQLLHAVWLHRGRAHGCYGNDVTFRPTRAAVKERLATSASGSGI